MIIPTADFDPMFAEDGIPFQTKMIDYIRSEFADLLGRHVLLLQTEEGLQRLAQLYNPGEAPIIPRRAA